MTCTVSVQVQQRVEAPTILEPPKPMTVQEGEDMKFSCKLSGTQLCNLYHGECMSVKVSVLHVRTSLLFAFVRLSNPYHYRVEATLCKLGCICMYVRFGMYINM